MKPEYRNEIEIHIPRLLDAFKSDLNSAMDQRHRSVITKSGDIELTDILSRNIMDNDCYGVASDILTSEHNGSVQTRGRESKDTLNRLMTFQKALRQQYIKVSYTKKLSRI